jgi:hypothetical protein
MVFNFGYHYYAWGEPEKATFLCSGRVISMELC